MAPNTSWQREGLGAYPGETLPRALPACALFDSEEAVASSAPAGSVLSSKHSSTDATVSWRWHIGAPHIQQREFPGRRATRHLRCLLMGSYFSQFAVCGLSRGWIPHRIFGVRLSSGLAANLRGKTPRTKASNFNETWPFPPAAQAKRRGQLFQIPVELMVALHSRAALGSTWGAGRHAKAGQVRTTGRAGHIVVTRQKPNRI